MEFLIGRGKGFCAMSRPGKSPSYTRKYIVLGLAFKPWPFRRYAQGKALRKRGRQDGAANGAANAEIAAGTSPIWRSNIYTNIGKFVFEAPYPAY